MHTHTHACMHAILHTYAHKYMRKRIHATNIHIQSTHRRTHTHTHTHIYIYIYVTVHDDVVRLRLWTVANNGLVFHSANDIDRKDRIIRRKPCPSATLSATNLTWTNPGLRCERLATNRLSHGTAPAYTHACACMLTLHTYCTYTLCLHSLVHTNVEVTVGPTGKFVYL
jgi:hypothetical protein